jgi:hypothetical protein
MYFKAICIAALVAGLGLPLASGTMSQDKDPDFDGVVAPTPTILVRGEGQLTTGSTEIVLPAWFESFAKSGGRTVQLTCKGGWSPLSAGAVENGKFTVSTTSSDSKTQAFYWEVKADQK